MEKWLLVRFNASDFSKRLKGKRLMLVGSTVNRNQFESLLLHNITQITLGEKNWNSRISEPGFSFNNTSPEFQMRLQIFGQLL
uniref:Trichome birefringence-like C-terminal domain-containing protein n=1 Tax=Solanum lycopersicum TaxID=4081 RepID=K4CBG9_SOLLC